MIPGWLSSGLSFLANLLGWGREVDQRKNSPEIVANKKSADYQKSLDRIRDLDILAQSSNPKVRQKALDELRKITSA